MIRIDGDWFKDEYGRTLILRGVNLGGSSKVPFQPDGATHIRQGFFDHRQVSFVGRPFPLAQADEHFARLRAWGFTCLRFLVTWEAIEHAGPGSYDQAYLDYLTQVVAKAGDHGIDLIIDPHQDVWSRFSGGDGAPGWTFEAVGLDMTRFSETGAATVHAVHGDPFPRMIWPTNATKLAAATLFTLFFAGDDLAPHTRMAGEPVQGYLQRHYLNAMKQVAARLKGLPNVIGYDTMNEPLSGYIGWPDLRAEGGLLKKGLNPSPFQAMLLGAGYPQELAVYDRRISGVKAIGRRVVNPGRVRAWLDGADCIWKQNGVWDVAANGEPRLLRPDYFARAGGRAVDFNRDYYRPFANRYAAEIRAIHPGALIFVETAPLQPAPCWSPGDAPDIVYAPHWYDGFVLYMKDFNPFLGVDMHAGRLVVGPRRIRRSFAAQLARYKRDAAGRLGGVPTLIGEFGIAFDLKDKRAYRTGNFSAQIKALDRSFRAIEDNLLSGALWNYTADNTNRRGDGWNGEDLSIWSRDQQTDAADIHSGGRALPAVVRPYPRKVAGEPLRLSFDLKRRVFAFEFRHDPAVAVPTEIFVPNYQYPQGYRVEISDGRVEMDREAQTLVYHHDDRQAVHRIKVLAR
ncbi:MAG: cellulase family glycosylhydrolase [Chloroflexota bacterium]